MSASAGAQYEPEGIDLTLAALADPLRRRTIELLSERPRKAGELAEALRVSAPVMSRHLKVLRDADLVAGEHPASDARVRVYSLRTAAMGELERWLAYTEAGWTEQLNALRDHLEAR